MKKTALFVFCVVSLCNTYSWSQVSFGIKAGLGAAGCISSPILDKSTGNGNSKEVNSRILSPTLGFVFDARLGKWGSLQFGLQYAKNGYKGRYEYHNSGTSTNSSYEINARDDYKIVYHYVQLPVILNINIINKETYSAGLGIGPYVAYAFDGNGKAKHKNDFVVKEGLAVVLENHTESENYIAVKQSDTYSDDIMSYDVKIGSSTKAYVKPHDYGFVTSVFFKYHFSKSSSLQMTPYFTYGLFDTVPSFNGQNYYRRNKEKDSSKNYSFGCSFAILYSLGKKRE